MSGRSSRARRDRRLRPLGVIEMMDEAIELYKRNFVLFFGMSTAATLLGVATSNILRGTAWYLWGVVFAVTLQPIYYGIATLAAADLYFDAPPVSTGYFRRVLSRRLFPRLWATCVLTYLVSQGPLILISLDRSGTLGVLGFFALLWFILAELGLALTIPACIMESLGARRALRRSSALMKGSKMKLIVLWMCYGVALAVVALTLWALQWAVRSAGLVSLSATAWRSAVFGASGAITTPLLLISLVIFYYDIRVRKEGYDMQLMAEELERMNEAAARREPQMNEERIEKE